MLLKQYQSEALDWLEKFFKRCADSKDPQQAYAQTTMEWRDLPLRYHSLPSMPEVPYVCLRIPTGGGKTMIGGMAIERANRTLRYAEHSVTLWLVPSEPIREQTLKALRSPDHILHQAMLSALGEVRVLDIDEALRVKPNVLAGANVIIVATMQAFKRKDKDTLNVYKQNSEMMPHFAEISDKKAVGDHSLVDMLRLHRPLLIVDEAHNQGTLIAFETLARFRPCAVLELTATPDRVNQPSNVLYSVGASTLQAADMIKMPLTLVRRENWREVLRDAIAYLNKLQASAQAESAASGDYLRPVMLLQAERKDEHETVVPETVKQALMNDFGIPEAEIAIATGAVDELGDEDILSDKSRKRFIITIDKLREGWDCPFAYVLCSFRNTSSGTAAEQILGRIMRMPHATRKANAVLNEAYAFITSANMQEAVENLRDGLVRNGFERQEAKDLIQAVADSGTPGDDLFSIANEVTYSSPELPEPSQLPAALMDKVEVTPENGSITLKGVFTPKQAAALEQVFQTKEGRAGVQAAIAKAAAKPAPRVVTPAERGEKLAVPLLTLRQGELWEPFEETHILQGDWRLLDYSAELSESEFKKPDVAAQGGRFSVGDKVKFEYLDDAGTPLALFEHTTDWDQVRLVDWLAKNIPDDWTPPDDKAAFLDKALTWLREKRGYSLSELNYAKARLRKALEEKMAAARRQAMQTTHQQLLGLPDTFRTSSDEVMVFANGRYAYDWPYVGFTALPKHFYPNIGNLRDWGEEFDCALFIATQLPGVKYWVRNVERKPTSFSLQTGTDRFYPDFICQLQDGRILVIEYKNSRDWELPDNEEKRRLGELWAARSAGKCLFIMPKGRDWPAITALANK